jgi:putative membrane protein
MSARAPIQLEALRGVNPKRGIAVVIGVSLAALALLLFVIYGHRRADAAPPFVAWLPAVNASLNAASAVLLVAARRAIARRAVAAHARLMLGALGTSAVFLVSYLVYHAFHGDSRFAGQGAIRPFYFFVLITHVVLSALVLPMIFTSFFLSLSGRFPQHAKISRWTFPVWLYVSVTGVLVFLLLRAYA